MTENLRLVIANLLSCCVSKNSPCTFTTLFPFYYYYENYSGLIGLLFLQNALEDSARLNGPVLTELLFTSSLFLSSLLPASIK